MKKRNYSKVIWIVGLFVSLILILYLVVVYKVKYEDMYKLVNESSGSSNLCSLIFLIQLQN